MRIGLFDVDNSYRGKITYPNLALMKLSAWHKTKGDTVEWVHGGGEYDLVYVSKVFSDEYSKEQLPMFTAGQVIRGGSGYAFGIENGREVYNKDLDSPLPYEIEHIYPDYGIYGISDNAYGRLTIGCPRGCNFCHVAGMQGRTSRTVARLEEFWFDQKTIHLSDPNILACKDWRMHFQDLIDSKAYIDFNQGLDVRLLTEEKADYLNRMKVKSFHFAWDNPSDDLRQHLENAKKWLVHARKYNTSVYILTNNGEDFDSDVMRVEFVKSLRFQPYVMVYRKPTAPKEIRQLSRYANNPYVCWATPSWSDYKSGTRADESSKNKGIKHKDKGSAMR